MTSKQEIMEKENRHVIYGWGYLPIVFTEARGAALKDIDGKEYIDLLAGAFGSTCIGHSDRKVIEAVQRQVEKLANCHFIGTNIPKAEAAEKISRVTPPGLNKIFFTCSGGEANETALKGAMKFTGKKEVISLHMAYHGATLGCLSIGSWFNRVGYPTVPGFRSIPPAYCYRCFYGKTYPECDLECARALETTIRAGSNHDVAAFIMEAVQGHGGHIMPPTKEYFKIIREICDKYDVIFIVDEVQTAPARTGNVFACQTFDFTPDVICVGKGLGGGLPVGAAIFKEDLLPPDFSKAVWPHAITNSGQPVLMAAASAVIDVVLEKRLADQALKMGAYVRELLRPMEENDPSVIGEIRGPGLFIGVELVQNTNTKELPTPEQIQMVTQKCLEGGVITTAGKGGYDRPDVGNVFKVKPPIVITEEQAQRAVEVFERAVKETFRL